VVRGRWFVVGGNCVACGEWLVACGGAGNGDGTSDVCSFPTTYPLHPTTNIPCPRPSGSLLSRASRGPCRVMTPRLSLQFCYWSRVNRWLVSRQSNLGFLYSMDPGSPSADSLGRPGIRTKTACGGWPVACRGSRQRRRGLGFVYDMGPGSWCVVRSAS